MNGPTETPQQAARRLAASAIRDGYEPEALHTYTYPDGGVWYWRIRLKNPHTGEKWIRPMRLNGAGFELGEPDFPDGKPLYRLHDLTARPDHRVFLVEGEWCADALAKAATLATTSGAADSAAKANWRPLAGRDVTIWPDNHEAGQRYATEAGERLRALGCTVRVIDVDKLRLPKKGDAVDWLAANPAATAAEILELPCIEAEAEKRRKSGSSAADLIEAAIAKLGEDVGAVFEVEVIAALQVIRERNSATYQRLRKRIKDAGASVGELDRLVRANGMGEVQERAKGRRIELYEPEPWTEPVDGAAVLDDAYAAIKRHMHISDEHAAATTLWSAHTHSYEVFMHTPRFLITAPTEGCGKTILLYHLVGTLAPRPQPIELMKPAPFFRMAEEFKPCFLIDECDVFIKEDSELLAAINNGWEPHGGVCRCVGEDFEVRMFSTHTPVALGGVNLHKKLPATTWSRSIIISLERAAAGEIREHYDPRTHRAGLLELGRRLARWFHDKKEDLRRADPGLPGEPHNRRADKWRPLFAIAEVAGGAWPERAKRAYLAEERADNHKTSIAKELLEAIRDILHENEHVIATTDLLGRLCARPDSIWADYNRRERDPERRQIQSRQLARLLKDYNVGPGTVRLPGGQTPKGYTVADFQKLFSRWLPPDMRHSVTT